MSGKAMDNALKFEEKVNTLITNLEQHTHFCPASIKRLTSEDVPLINKYQWYIKQSAMFFLSLNFSIINLVMFTPN